MTEQFYPFLINARDGNVLYHPNLASFDSKMDTFDPVHYSYLEFTGNPSDDPIKKIIDGMAVSAELVNQNRYVVEKKDNGFVTTTEFRPNPSDRVTEKINMKCQKITIADTDSSYIVCVVEVVEGPNATPIPGRKILNAQSGNLRPENFLYNTLKDQLEDHLGLAEMCSHGPRNSVTARIGAMKFSPRQFTSSFEYVSEDYSQERLESPSRTPFVDYYSAMADSRISEELDHVWQQQDVFMEDLFNQNRLTAEYVIGNDNPVPITVWRYFGMASGSMRVYPAISLPVNYDPTARPWYKLAMTDPDKTFLSAPYIDAFGMGFVVTVTKAVKFSDGHDGVMGVLGTDYFLGQMGKLVDNNLSPCRDSTLPGVSTGNCILVDATGAVIWWDQFLKNPDLIMLKQSYLDPGSNEPQHKMSNLYIDNLGLDIVHHLFDLSLFQNAL